jgi:arylsulfatase A-like enzyme
LALPPDTVTLPRALKQVGYETCLVGKWHLGSLPEWGPNQFGFDHAYGSLAGGVSPWNHRYKKGPFTHTWHRNGDLIEEEGHVTDLLTDEAVSWIESRGKAPFFLYVPYTAVHLPLKEPQEWLDRVPDSITGDVARHYAASVMHLDDGVGRIVAALESKGIFRDTLLVFTSDNGGSTVENNDLKYPDDNCPSGRLTGNNDPLRGGKGTLYEGGTRVPTILSWPARCKAGQLATPLMITDWMPTFCALAGYQSQRDLDWDGDDFSSLLTKGTPMPPRSLYAVGPRERAVSLRRGNWKLILRGSGENQEIELFNLSADQAEAMNLAASETERVEELKAELQRVAGSDRDAVAR